MASTQRQRRCSLEQQLYNGLKVEVGKNSKCHCKLAKKGQEHRDKIDLPVSHKARKRIGAHQELEREGRLICFWCFRRLVVTFNPDHSLIAFILP